MSLGPGDSVIECLKVRARENGSEEVRGKDGRRDCTPALGRASSEGLFGRNGRSICIPGALEVTRSRHRDSEDQADRGRRVDASQEYRENALASGLLCEPHERGEKLGNREGHRDRMSPAGLVLAYVLCRAPGER